mmetsp:Transcript_10145/g.14356  ORF Transcript_10145/g.14356 Transcript_10145/m.14356 type:complete len:179 (+) Transcript_10145:552-1088(+)
MAGRDDAVLLTRILLVKQQHLNALAIISGMDQSVKTIATVTLTVPVTGYVLRMDPNAFVWKVRLAVIVSVTKNLLPSVHLPRPARVMEYAKMENVFVDRVGLDANVTSPAIVKQTAMETVNAIFKMERAFVMPDLQDRIVSKIPTRIAPSRAKRNRDTHAFQESSMCWGTDTMQYLVP